MWAQDLWLVHGNLVAPNSGEDSDRLTIENEAFLHYHQEAAIILLIFIKGLVCARHCII